MVVLFALGAVGTTAIGVGAAERPPSVGQLSRPGSAPSTPAPQHVDLFGDSLGYQAEPYLDMFFAQSHDYTVSNHTYGGTATCDWLSKMSAAAAKRPQAALLVFSGNAFTPCMDGVTLRSLSCTTTATPPDTRKQAIRIFSAVGAHVFLVGTPIDESSVAGWEQLDHIYRRLAQANPVTVTYVEAGASVETATGGFALDAALPEHRTELWPRRDQRGAVARRYPLLPRWNPGHTRRHPTVWRVFAGGVPIRTRHGERRHTVRLLNAQVIPIRPPPPWVWSCAAALFMQSRWMQIFLAAPP